MVKKYKVYIIRNIIEEDKVYIGYTQRSLDVRFKEHCKAKTKLGEYIQLLGSEFFTIELIDKFSSKKKALRIEEAMIRLHKPYLNTVMKLEPCICEVMKGLDYKI